jgi:radical SAM protein with 4Fe4S-binding SPASM domain
MISISKLYTGLSQAHDGLRYGVRSDEGVPRPHGVAKSARRRRPVVVWNLTRTCNLRCLHCYSDSAAEKYPGELTKEELLAVAQDLIDYQVPAVLLSGGEPLVHPHFWDIAEHLIAGGRRVVLSTNATLITKEVARRLADLGVIYVGASLDGIGVTNDLFRGVEGAFDRAVRGIRNAKAAGLQVSLRMTLTKHNIDDLDGIARFVEAEDIERVCFYHLAYTGSGRGAEEDDCSPRQTREAMQKILAWARQLQWKGQNRDILTVGNHADGPFLWLKLKQEGRDEEADEAWKLLSWNGGGANSSAVGIADIDFLGEVHADQFSMHESFGNVKDRPFSEIWEDESHPVLAAMRNRLPRLKGRCGECRFVELCGGALRVRAQMATGDRWEADPACYLTDAEIAPPVEEVEVEETEELEAAVAV